jgi:hypothetical protein
LLIDLISTLNTEARRHNRKRAGRPVTLQGDGHGANIVHIQKSTIARTVDVPLTSSGDTTKPEAAIKHDQLQKKRVMFRNGTPLKNGARFLMRISR